MQSISRIEGIRAPLILDASVVINLVASAHGNAVLRALGNNCFVTENVLTELSRGNAKHKENATALLEMLTRGHLVAVELHADGYEVFEELVGGEACHTLDDGEAATIAHALAVAGVAVIDERKATTICGANYGHLRLASTVDLFSHPNVATCLSAEALKVCVLNALNNARMSVSSSQAEWVVSLIGEEQAQQCRSLRRVLKQ